MIVWQFGEGSRAEIPTERRLRGNLAQQLRMRGLDGGLEEFRLVIVSPPNAQLMSEKL